MAKIDGRATIRATITIALSEEEAAALDALVGYGVEAFLSVFYEHLGKAYLQPHEQGLRSLFESVRRGEGSVESFLQASRDARDVFHRTKRAVPLAITASHLIPTSEQISEDTVKVRPGIVRGNF